MVWCLYSSFVHDLRPLYNKFPLRQTRLGLMGEGGGVRERVWQSVCLTRWMICREICSTGIRFGQIESCLERKKKRWSGLIDCYLLLSTREYWNSKGGPRNCPPPRSFCSKRNCCCIIAINRPTIYTATYIMLLMRANPLRGQVGGG